MGADVVRTVRKAASGRYNRSGGSDPTGVEEQGMGTPGFSRNVGGPVVSRLHHPDGGQPEFSAPGRPRACSAWSGTKTGTRRVPPSEGNEARRDGRREVGAAHSTVEAGESRPAGDPVEGRRCHIMEPLKGHTPDAPPSECVSLERQRIAASMVRLCGRSETVMRRAGCVSHARPDLWGAWASNRPGLPDHGDPERGTTGMTPPSLKRRALKWTGTITCSWRAKPPTQATPGG